MIGWDLQETLTDTMLKSFLESYSGTYEAILNGWCEYMKRILEITQNSYFASSELIN
ncbi:TPA: hypothetical protein ACJI8U_000640 [Morganella morganii]